MSMPVLSRGGSHCCPLRTTPAQGGRAVTAGPDNSISVGAAVTGEEDSAAAAAAAAAAAGGGV
jgi:hypothetical protein